MQTPHQRHGKLSIHQKNQPELLKADLMKAD